MSATVGVRKLSELMGVTPRRVQQLVREGMPLQGRGRYDPIAAMSWFIHYRYRRWGASRDPLDLDVDDILDDSSDATK